MPVPWKELEREAARLLGGRRHVREHRGEAGPDVDMPNSSPFRVECKCRAKLPRFLLNGLAQAARGGAPEAVPILILKQRRQRGALAVLALEDLARLLGVAPINGAAVKEESGVRPVERRT